MAKNEYVEPNTLASLDDILKLMDGDAVQIDYTEDAWSYGAPPPGEQVYKFKLFLDKDGIKQGLEDKANPKSIYIQFNLIGKITEGEFEGTPIYTKVNTRIYRGKSISTMAGLLSKLVKDPNKIPNPISPARLAALLGKILQTEPIVKGELDWRGAYQFKDKDGKDQWENVYKHYREFPQDPEDSKLRLHEVTIANKHNGGSALVRAQTSISRFFAKNEEPPKAKVIGANGNGTLGTVAVPELDLDDTPSPTLVSQPKPQGVVAPVVDDMDLMLE